MMKGGVVLNLTVNDWLVLAGYVVILICIVLQISFDSKTREEMRVYRGKFFELMHMYEAVNAQLKDVTDLNGRILALNDEVIKNDESILNDAKRLMTETEELCDRVKEGVRERSVYKTLGSDLESGE